MPSSIGVFARHGRGGGHAAERAEERAGSAEQKGVAEVVQEHAAAAEAERHPGADERSLRVDEPSEDRRHDEGTDAEEEQRKERGHALVAVDVHLQEADAGQPRRRHDVEHARRAEQVGQRRCHRRAVRLAARHQELMTGAGDAERAQAGVPHPRHAERVGAGHDVMLVARDPQVLGADADADDRERADAVGGDGADGRARDEVMVLREVLLDDDLVRGRGQPAGGHEDVIERRHAGVGQRQQPQLDALVADGHGHRGDRATGDGANAGERRHARHVAGIGIGDVDVQIGERQAPLRIGVARREVEIRSGRRDEQEHPERRHRQHGQGLPFVRRQLADQLACEQHLRPPQ